MATRADASSPRRWGGLGGARRALPSVFELRSLQNRRFRWMLLALFAAGVVPAFVGMVLLYPVIAHGRPSDDFNSYIAAARLLNHGSDPYAAWFANQSIDPARRHGYIYPPLLAWILGPIANAPATALLAGSLLVELVLLTLFWLVTLRELQVRDRQVVVLLVLGSVAFFPVHQNFQWGQVNLLLLLLSALWLRSWRGGGALTGGAALGLSIALKLLQAPVLLLAIAKRRWDITGAALVAVALGWGIAAPQFLGEYFTRVLPTLSAGTAWTANLAPLALLARFVRPDSLLGNPRDVSSGVHAAAVLVAIGVLVVTFVVVRGSRSKSLGAAAVTAVCPLVSTIVWPAHVALLVLPMAILVTAALRRRDAVTLFAVAAAWLLLGPVQELLWGIGDRPQAFESQFGLIWALAQASALGLWVIWLASLRALRAMPEEA